MASVAAVGTMNKTEAIAAVIRTAATEPMIFTTGYASRIAKAVADRDNHFYMTGSMGLAANIGTGVSLTLKRSVVVLDGDGALAMNPSCLLAAGAIPNLRLVHVVIDDQRYESTGGQESPTRQVDFCAMARSAGYANAVSVADVKTLTQCLQALLARCCGPVLIHCQVSTGDAAPPPRIDVRLDVHTQRFSTYLRQPLATINT